MEVKVSSYNASALVDAADALRALHRTAEAVPLYERALQLSPTLIEALNNFGNALVELKRYDEAVSCYRKALTISPESPQLHFNLGNVLRLIGSFEEALTVTESAIELDASLAAAYNNRGLTLVALGRRSEAVASYRRALSLDGRDIDVLNNLGNALRDLGDLREAIACYARAADIEPERAESHCNLGHALLERRRIDAAVESYGRAVTVNPRYAAAHLGLATAKRLLGELEEAEASCRQALMLDPNLIEALSFQSVLCADRGDFASSEQLCWRVLELNGSFPVAYLNIAVNRRMTREDVRWLRGAEACLAGDVPLRHKISLLYALGKYFDDIGEYDTAFEKYRTANELTSRYGARYDSAGMSARVSRIIRSFDLATQRRLLGVGDVSDRPVFVIGMPRAGTTLTEQILASHPSVCGAGELTFWDEGFAAYVAAGLNDGAGERLLPAMAADYLARLRRLSASSLRVVDKMPANFMNVGLIHAALPNARFIHVRRHPLDTCLSIYFQHFGNTQPYASDLDSIVHYYGEYVRLMEHWTATLPPDLLLNVDYEVLIENPEQVTRRMLEFIGLEWNSNCLTFYRTERNIITHSKWQVRQKIQRAAAGRWKNYEKYLGPLQRLRTLRNGAT